MSNENLAYQEEFDGEIQVGQESEVWPEGYVIERDDEINLALRLIYHREREIRRIDNMRKRETERVNAWADVEIEKLYRAIDHFTHSLRFYMESVNKVNPKTKSLKFPLGTIGIRKTPDKVEITQPPEEVRELWPDMVKEKMSLSVDKKAVLAKIKETGEVPGFAEVIPGESKFYYKMEGV